MHKFIAHNYTHKFSSSSSTALGNPSGSTSLLFRQPSRRSACDRCRAQKLRCIRDGSVPRADSGTGGGAGGCRRCLKMGAECTTTSSAVATGATGRRSRSRSVRRGMIRQQPEKEGSVVFDTTPTSTSTSDLENHIPGDTNTRTSADTDNWTSRSLPALTTPLEPEPKHIEMQQKLHADNDNDNDDGLLDILTPNESGAESFQIFDPMLFGLDDSSLMLHDDYYAVQQPVQNEQADNITNLKEKNAVPKEKEEKEEEITIHTIAATLEQYLAQLNRGPPEITLSKILFITTEKQQQKTCQRAHTIDTILQHTTHFINLLKAHHHQQQQQQQQQTEIMLRMLAIYTTILKLFLILFAHIHIFLHDTIHTTSTATNSMSSPGTSRAKKIAAVIEPVPDVQFIGLDIQSGHLQVTLFLQIVAHLIRSMESLLGISSAEYVLVPGKPAADMHMHKNDSGLRAIIDAVMHRETHTIDAIRGYGGVPALRKEMDAVKQLLEQIPL